MHAMAALTAPPAPTHTRTQCSSGPRAPLRPGAVFRRALRLPSPPPGATTSAGSKDVDEEQAPASTTSTSSVGKVLTNLASRLLMNAASLRAVRAQSYCVQCRGTGRTTCSACQGAGIMQNEPVRMNQIKHAAGKVKVLLGINDTKMHDSDWQLTNRCKRCRGTGALPCVHCSGTGLLGPQPRK